ncbi:MAG: hypothetical protein JWR69_2020 [Pedosphaera sp.]|nr:hypothetical protein [Pedosphaera sp.]
MRYEVQSPVEVQAITSLAALESLRDEWAGLWNRCPSATPFQCPDWLIPWWRHLGVGELLVLALRRDQQLRGIVPLVLDTQPSQRVALLLGTGITDYLDGLWEMGMEDCGAKAVFNYLAGQQDRWDICDFQQLRSDSPLLAPAATPPEWADEITVQECCPVLTLPTESEALRRSIPHGQLRNLSYCQHRLERMKDGRMEPGSERNLEELLHRLFELHTARWSARGRPGVLADAAVQEFHREVAPAFLRRGMLRLNGLYLAGRIAAVYYGFSHGEQTFFYLAGFDPALERLSLGTVLIGHAIEQAVREKRAEFDFLRGREDYKYRWGAQDHPNYRRRIRSSAGFL